MTDQLIDMINTETIFFPKETPVGKIIQVYQNGKLVDEREIVSDDFGRKLIHIPIKQTIILPRGTKKEDVIVYQGSNILYQGENIN